MQIIQPGDFIRFRNPRGTRQFKLVVDRKGIRLRPARLFEQLGVIFGANMSDGVADGEYVRILGQEFVMVVRLGDTSPDLRPNEPQS